MMQRRQQDKPARQLSESSREIIDLRSSPDAGVTLVRPDGYVAFEAKDHDGTALVASVRSVLERQTNRLTAAAH